MNKGQTDRIMVHGVPVDCMTMDQVVAWAASALQGSKAAMIATADTSGLVICQDDPALMRAYHEADVVTADSIGVTWALGRRGRPIRTVSGVELVDQLFALSSRTGARVFILGSAPGVAAEAGEALVRKHPGAVLAGIRHGYFSAAEEEGIAAEIAKAKPDILFVALGIPRQEIFILNHKDVIGAKISIGVGGSFDVYSGRVKRAPEFVQKAKLEWLWRLILNPKKIKKASTLPKFALRELFKKPS